MPIQLLCKNYTGKVMGDGEKKSVFASFFG